LYTTAEKSVPFHLALVKRAIWGHGRHTPRIVYLHTYVERYTYPNIQMYFNTKHEIQRLLQLRFYSTSAFVSISLIFNDLTNSITLYIPSTYINA
jgi:hypothetical protein